MTEYKQKDNTTNLFKNTKKNSEKHPDLTGSIKITEPGEYWVSAWKGKTQNGDFKLGISLTKKGKKEEKKQEQKEVNQDELDEEIPF